MKQRKIAKTVICLGIIIYLVFGMVQRNMVMSDEEKQEVLILNSYKGHTDVSNKAITEMIREIELNGLDLKYYIEFMHDNHSKLADDFTDLEEMMEQKYRDKQFDLIIVIGYDAFHFAQQSTLPLLAQSPIMIGSISQYMINDYPLKRPVMGNITRVDPGEYYQLIKNLQPAVKEVYCLQNSMGEKNTVEKSIEDTFEQKGVQVEPISLDQLRDIFSNHQTEKLNEVALVLGYMMIDAEGEYIDSAKVLDEVRQIYQGPIYMSDELQFLQIRDNWEGAYPPIGGVMRDRANEGRVLGYQVREFFEEGQHLDELVILKEKCVLDYQALINHGLFKKNLSYRYSILGMQGKDVILPKGVMIYALSIFLMVLCMVAFSLFILVQKNKWLIYQNRLRKAHYKLLVSLLPDGVIEVNEGKIIYINKVGVNYLDGTQVQDFLEKDIDSFLDIGGRTKLQQERQIVTTLSGEKKEAAVHCTYYFAPGFTTIILIRDLTKQKLVREQKEYYRLKKEFFANISHELRTPINVILATGQLIEKKLEQKGDQSLQQYNRILMQNSYRLVRLINNLIDLTKFEAGFMELYGQVYNLVEVTEEVVQGILPYARRKGMKVTFDTEKEEFYAFIDKEKYERIILNLLSNAIKYNREQGEILLHIGCQYGILTISVWDQGIGIPRERIPVIFDPFVQVNKSSVRLVEGSGIGLAMVKALVDLHEGHITVDSKEGEYTCFALHLLEVDIKEEDVVVEGGYAPSKAFIYTEISDIDFE